MAARPATCPPKLEERRRKPGPLALPLPRKSGFNLCFPPKPRASVGPAYSNSVQCCTKAFESRKSQFNSAGCTLSPGGTSRILLLRCAAEAALTANLFLLSGTRTSENKSGSEEPVSSPVGRDFFHSRIGHRPTPPEKHRREGYVTAVPFAHAQAAMRHPCATLRSAIVKVAPPWVIDLPCAVNVMVAGTTT